MRSFIRLPVPAPAPAGAPRIPGSATPGRHAGWYPQRRRGRRLFRTVALRKLAILNRVVRVQELKIPPNNRLEALKGDRKGQWSIRIDDQWRICFRFSNGRALDVEIVDYH